MSSTDNNRGKGTVAFHTAQLPVLGVTGLAKLRHARVHISGAGRIGTALAQNLAASGIGHLSVNDPQTIERENLGSFIFARSSDIGKEKVYVLRRCFAGKPHLTFEGLPYPAESDAIDSHIRQSTLIVSCANTARGRLAAERKAIRYGKPVMQVAALDGRNQLGGLVTLRLPEQRWSACFGCYLGVYGDFPPGEGLLSTVTGSLAAVASHMALMILTGLRSRYLIDHNIFFLDLEKYRIDALAVVRSRECSICAVS